MNLRCFSSWPGPAQGRRAFIATDVYYGESESRSRLVIYSLAIHEPFVIALRDFRHSTTTYAIDSNVSQWLISNHPLGFGARSPKGLFLALRSHTSADEVLSSGAIAKSCCLCCGKEEPEPETFSLTRFLLFGHVLKRIPRQVGSPRVTCRPEPILSVYLRRLLWRKQPAGNVRCCCNTFGRRTGEWR